MPCTYGDTEQGPTVCGDLSYRDLLCVPTWEAWLLSASQSLCPCTHPSWSLSLGRAVGWNRCPSACKGNPNLNLPSQDRKGANLFSLNVSGWFFPGPGRILSLSLMYLSFRSLLPPPLYSEPAASQSWKPASNILQRGVSQSSYLFT